jgi:hypothetical protein
MKASAFTVIFQITIIAGILGLACAASAQGMEYDGKTYSIVGQEVGIEIGKQVPVTVYGGLPFPVSRLKVDGELVNPLTIRITGFQKGRLTVTEESVVPVYNNFDFRTGSVESKLYTQAINVTWEFTTAGITFDADGVIYKSERVGASISFSKAGVVMNGVSKVPKPDK